jgi:Domain of unknown function (DUF4129)
MSRAPRGLVAAAVLMAGLLAVVALASQGHEGREPAAAGRALPAGAIAYAYAALFVLALVAVPLAFYVHVRDTRYSRTRRSRAWLLPLGMAVVTVAAVVVPTPFGDEFSNVVDRLRLWPGGNQPADSGRLARPPAPEWLPFILVASLATAGAGMLAARRLGGRPGRLGQRRPLAEELPGALDDLRAEPDPRRAVIRTYSRMETLLRSAGASRTRSEAPLEYSARVLLELDLASEPVLALTELFERAKFSRRGIERQQKEEAIQALEQIGAELERP